MQRRIEETGMACWDSVIIYKGGYMKHRFIPVKAGLFLWILFALFLGAGVHGSLNAASKTLMLAGETAQLPSGGTSGFRSSKPQVAGVNAAGIVTAVRQGSCRITAMRGGRKVTWKIKVLAPYLGKTNQAVVQNRSFTLKLRKASGIDVSWSVSDPSVLKLEKKGTNKYRITGLKPGTASVVVRRGAWQAACSVTVTEAPAQPASASDAAAAPSSAQPEPAEPADPNLQTLYMDGNVFKQLTWNRTDTAVYVSSVSRYGQSAPLYVHKDGGDGLENIWAATNNGAVGIAGTKLSQDAVKGTIDKACLWARAIADSPYHGYDYGHDYKGANLMYTFGQAKPTGLGTGDYCCSTIPLCAYYFAGVNVIGENLGGADAKYIPESTKLFYEGKWGEITFYENGVLTGARYLSNYEWMIFRACGFTDVVDAYNSNKNGFQFQPGDVVTANGHSQIVLSAGTRKTAETVQAYGPDKVKGGGMPKGGDQNYEIGRAYGVRTSPKIRHIMRFTGEGVRLNTVGLVS